MKLLYKVSADLIFLVHALLFLVILFGWAIPSIWYIYMSLLVITLLSDLVFGYCPISKWEFYLRKKVNPEVSYDYHWSSYYTRWLTSRNLSPTFFFRVAIFFLTSSLVLNLYF